VTGIFECKFQATTSNTIQEFQVVFFLLKKRLQWVKQVQEAFSCKYSGIKGSKADRFSMQRGGWQCRAS
jgi:hypothetical protein